MIKRCTSHCIATTAQFLYLSGSVKVGLADSLASHNLKISNISKGGARRVFIVIGRRTGKHTLSETPTVYKWCPASSYCVTPLISHTIWCRKNSNCPHYRSTQSWNLEELKIPKHLQPLEASLIQSTHSTISPLWRVVWPNSVAPSLHLLLVSLEIWVRLPSLHIKQI